MKEYSVCMSVYKNDNADWFIAAVRSIWEQTVKPKEIVLVVDGPIHETLEKAVVLLQSEINSINLLRLPKNLGHASARQMGLNAVCTDIVAIMDSDDLALPNRFEKQLRYLEQYPEVSVVGGLINEFIDTVDNVVGTRIVPMSDLEIKKYMKSRCPMNLVTVMARKSDIMAVGGFQEWYCEEDYFLWIRMALNGYKFYNLQENLVNVRVGKDMYARRGGWKYFKSEYLLQKYMYGEHIISCFHFIFNVIVRFGIEVVMPNKLRALVFQKLLRK